MPRPAVQLGVLDGQLPRENAAVVQGCVPLVILKGKSYRLRERGTSSTPAPLEKMTPPGERADGISVG